MRRREFNLCSASLALLPALMPSTALAQPKAPEEGIDYVTLDRRVPSEAPAGKIDVIEFFWYSCPHCNAFEPRLEAWIKRLPADVALRRVPVAFRESFVPQQRLFYALEAMGKLEDMHRKVFFAIHGERQALDNPERITEWVGKQGLDQAKFTEIFNSFTVQTKARRAAQLQNDFKAQGVPSMGIGGRFYTDGTIALTMDRALQVTDYLIDQVRRELPSVARATPAPQAVARAPAPGKAASAPAKAPVPRKPASAPAKAPAA